MNEIEPSMEMMQAYKKEMNRCNDIENKDERIQCKLEVIWKITKLQDYANLNTIRDLDNINDERWIPLHMIDELNAIILGILRNNAIPESIARDNYIKNHKSYFEDMYIQITGEYR